MGVAGLVFFVLSQIKLTAITNNAGGAEEGEGAKPKSGLFSLPFMTRAAERQRLNAQQEAAAVLAQLEAEDEQAPAGSDADVEDGEPNGWESGNGNAGRLTFGGCPVAPHQVSLVCRLFLVYDSILRNIYYQYHCHYYYCHHYHFYYHFAFCYHHLYYAYKGTKVQVIPSG